MEESVTTLEQWRMWRRDGFSALPLVRRVPLGPGEDRPAEWSGAWQAAFPYAVIMESGKDGRYTYLGLRPAAVLRGKGDRAVELAADDPWTGTGAGTGGPPVRTGKPLDVVRSWIAGRRGPRVEDGPPFVGGIAGLWSYDIARSIKRLPERAADDLGLPDYVLLRLDELWIIDHETKELMLSCVTVVPDVVSGDGLAHLHREAADKTRRMLVVWRSIAEAAASPGALRRREARRAATEADRLEIDVENLDLIRPFSKASYMEAVEAVRRYIAQGDVFQVNLSQRMSKRTHVAAEDLYEWLRLFNPSPYMGVLRCPDFRLVSASPELLVKSRNNRLATRPIAGTRRRGRTPEEDRRMAGELLTSGKERAEHVMLVDLERNDLGRVCACGTVRVPELMAIERYSHVMHLVSQVEGELAPGKDAFDVIAAMFPGGTITGAPKVRTMEILEELEPVRRGPYCGSLGWIDYGGDMEFNILIRTMVIKDGVVHVQTGGGVVIDSDPEREYAETLNKAKALWKAVQYAEQEAAASAGRREPSAERREPSISAPGSGEGGRP